jgi:hypothetical protein
MRCAPLVLAVILTSCSQWRHADSIERPNVLAQYLNGAERQSETDEQRNDIRRALTDMLEKDPSILRTLRYPDYQGNPSAWSIVDVLRKYFVPIQPMQLDPELVYRDVSMPAAKEAIRRQLSSLASPE